MSSSFAVMLVIFFGLGLLLPGTILLNQWKQKRILGLLISGWCLVGTFVLISTLLLFFLITVYSYNMVLVVVLLTPVTIIAGLIATLAIGINNLVAGFSKDKQGKFNNSKIAVGFVILGINFTVVAAIIILIVLFMNGFIPIALM